jgi:O-antigen chain-terminating methyltransferase
MVDPLDKEINVDEIMERIREEVRRRKGLSQPEDFRDNGQSVSQTQPIQPMPASPPPIQQTPADKSFDRFLWKYGRKHKTIIKKIPILSSIAKKQHQKLIHQFISSSSAPPPPYSSPVHFDVLPYYINYHGFLEHAKKGEGLKGWFKFHLFKLIRFFGWWQEQINRALYQELIAQKARMDEKERRTHELYHQQLNRFTADLNRRDQVIEDLHRKLILSDQAKDKLCQDMDIHKTKINEMHERMESLFHRLMDDVKEVTIEAQNILNREISKLRIENTDVHKKLNDRIESTRQELSRLAAIRSAINQIAEEVKKHQLEILEQKRNLSIFLDENRLPDEVYVAFENQFRGTREEIKERLMAYLPYVSQTQVGEINVSVLDLGCGRGEWLELMKENGYIGRGVDINRVMVKQCRELGLDVAEFDILDYVRNQESNSISVITGFHILEHLPIKRILLLFDEVFRVLKRGGIAIFETPNPENLLVATFHFYLDPTHLHPLPSGLLSFLMESRGFKIVKIERRHPESFVQENQKTSITLESLISLFNQGRDYSIIAQKE